MWTTTNSSDYEYINQVHWYLNDMKEFTNYTKSLDFNVVCYEYKIWGDIYWNVAYTTFVIFYVASILKWVYTGLIY